MTVGVMDCLLSSQQGHSLLELMDFIVATIQNNMRVLLNMNQL